MRVAICDDQSVFLEKMECLLKGIEGISCIEKYDDINRLNEVLEKESYDLIFMDIAWKGQKDTGTNFAAAINERYPDIQIVFITAFNDKYAESIFFEKVNLCGYLIKPIKIKNLQFLVEKARKNIKKRREENLVISHKGITRKILFADIIYMESDAHRLFINTGTEQFMVYKKLDDYEEEMKESFVRAHKSYLINMKYITQIERAGVTLEDGTVLPVSKNRYQETKNKYFRFMTEQL